LGIRWNEAFGNKLSDEFKSLEEAITKDVESLYDRVPGKVFAIFGVLAKWLWPLAKGCKTIGQSWG